MANKPTETKHVKAHLTLEEHEYFSDLAREKNISMAELLRQSIGSIFENPRKRYEPKVEKKEVKVDADWKFQLNKMGTNLNNAVKISYIYKKPIPLRILQKIMADMEDLDLKITNHIKAQK